MKLTQFIKLLKTYFTLKIILLLPQLFYNLGEMGMYLYSVFQCLHPFIIVIVLFRAFIMKVQLLERGEEQVKKTLYEMT